MNHVPHMLVSSAVVPRLKLFVMGDTNKTYCGAEPVLGNSTVQPERKLEQWYKFTIPMSDFRCEIFVLRFSSRSGLAAVRC